MILKSKNRHTIPLQDFSSTSIIIFGIWREVLAANQFNAQFD